MARLEHKDIHVLEARIAVPDRLEPLRALPPISLVIPAYNEAAVIGQAVAEAEAALAKTFADFEVLIVDDGSSDGTAAAVEQQLPASPHTRLIRHQINRGYGAALRTGFETARFDLVAFTDADCQFDLADLGKLSVLAKDYPIVAGYRADRKDSLRRRFFSWGYNRLVRTLLGTRVRDCDCALKVFRKDVLKSLLPESRGFFVNAEMLSRARQLDLPVVERPVTHRPRLGGESKVSLGDIPGTLRALLGFWWRQVVWASPPVRVLRIPISGLSKASRPDSTPPPLSLPLDPVAPRERHRGAA